MPLNSPIITGDVSGGLHSTSVDRLKGSAVSSTAPTSGQVLTWDGAQWAPAASTGGGGGGANGLTYYFNQGTAADAPTTNIPGTPKQLGRTGETAQTSVTTGSLTQNVWTLVQGFVSESSPVDPSTTLIPAGIWDFNLWAFGNANANAGTSIRAKAYVYSGTTLTLLGTSSSQVINNTSAQYSLSVLVAQTRALSILVPLEPLHAAHPPSQCPLPLYLVSVCSRPHISNERTHVVENIDHSARVC
jgi:hypothetical protein